VSKPPPELADLPAHNFESLLLLAGLATVTMLKEYRFRPADGQAAVARYWSGHAWVALYRRDAAVPMPALSPGRQRLYDAARTCMRCRARFTAPINVLRDGKRYCGACLEPAALELWDLERERDRPIVARWAQGIVADPSVALAAAGYGGWVRRVLVCELDGSVLISRDVRDAVPREVPDDQSEIVASALSVEELAAALAGRRVMAWWDTTALNFAGDVLVPRGSPADRVGPWWDRWVREVGAGARVTSDRPWLHQHRPASDLPAQIEQMRQALADMAAVVEVTTNG
jgi:hypothetical protein